jgi:hypothetical protein
MLIRLSSFFRPPPTALRLIDQPITVAWTSSRYFRQSVALLSANVFACACAYSDKRRRPPPAQLHHRRPPPPPSLRGLSRNTGLATFARSPNSTIHNRRMRNISRPRAPLREMEKRSERERERAKDGDSER